MLKDSAGLPVPYFPVELYGRCLSELWMKSRLCKRADANGVCVLTGVPRAEGLQVLCGTDMPPEFVPALTPERQKVAAGNARFIFKAPAGKGNFMYVEPVNLAPDRNEQTVEITLLTLEEMKARKPSPK